MTVISVVALILCAAALFMTFKAEFVVRKLLKKECDEKMTLRVKYVALGVAVVAFLAIFLLDRSGVM